MKDGKYIVFTDGTAIVFSLDHVHLWQAGDRPVRSAGFFAVENGKVRTYGSSSTLNKSSRPEDANIISKLLKV